MIQELWEVEIGADKANANVPEPKATHDVVRAAEGVSS